MEKELLEAILAALEAQKAEIAALKAQIEAHGGDLGDIIDVVYGSNDQSEYDEFKIRHGAKFEPVAETLKVIHGEDFDPVRSAYDGMQETGEVDEDGYVDSVLAQAVEFLEKVKGVVPPESVPAIEEAEQTVIEAAESGEAETEEGMEEWEKERPKKEAKFY
jgi:hypothetical protein